MVYRRYVPVLPLTTYVDCLWYSEGFEGAHAFERLLPNGESGIVIDLREQAGREEIRIWDAEDAGGFGGRYDAYAPAIFCGARTDCFVIDTNRQDRVIGIQFRPGGAAPFLRMPVSEVANATYELDDVWPGEAGLLREELMAAAGVAAMFGILERTLLSRLRPVQLEPGIAFAAQWLATGRGDMRMDAVAERVGMGSRPFLERFRAQTGLAPKAFQRVRRFQRVLQALHGGGRLEGNFAGLAADCGYYDQAHFIHDFRRFAGMTPGAYLAAATPHLNHVPLG
jgi:AraC-like DNA-binding protein